MLNGSRELVFVITDCSDIAATEIRTAIRRECRALAIACPAVELVSIAPYDVLNANFACRVLAEDVDEPAAILVVVSAYGRQPPRRVIGLLKRRDLVFLGRDSGVFGWSADDFGVQTLVEPKAPLVQFGGKRTWPRFLARVCAQHAITDIGPSLSDSVRSISIADGTVVHIDNFGVAKIFLSSASHSQLRSPQSLRAHFPSGTVEQVQIIDTPYNTTAHGLCLFEGSSFGLPELAVAGGDFASSYNIHVGDVIGFEW